MYSMELSQKCKMGDFLAVTFIQCGITFSKIFIMQLIFKYCGFVTNRKSKLHVFFDIISLLNIHDCEYLDIT